MSSKPPNVSHIKVLSLSREVDECKALATDDTESFVLAYGRGETLVHFSAQSDPFLSVHFSDHSEPFLSVHFSAQSEPFLSIVTTQHTRNKMLTWSRNVDKCTALAHGLLVQSSPELGLEPAERLLAGL